MPASYTHQIFGDVVLKKLNNNHLKNIITKNINYYNIGLQGPDILFFYRPLKSNLINKLGNQLHEEIASTFFNNSIMLLKEKYDERSLAYILGFINHFILDSTCHHYIDKIMSEKKISHFEIERDLEQRFMIINNAEHKPHISNNYEINIDVAKVIAPFFKLKANDILKSLQQFRFFNNLFTCNNKYKRFIILNGMKIFKANKYQGMIIREKPEKKIEANIDILVNLFNQAIDVAIKEQIGYLDSYLNNKKLSNRFNCNYE